MSENNISRPSLLEPESTGGDIADGGFEFQRNIILNKIPYWLSFEGFTSLIWESIGDIEAKFFIPGIGLVNEAVEAKNHSVTPTEFWAEIERFKRIDKGSPGTYRWFTLSCTAVSPTINPLINGLKRIRNPYPFYDNSSGIFQNSYDAYKNIVLGMGKDEETAEFIFNKVLIENTWGSLNAQSEGMFSDSLSKNFPVFDDLPRKKTNIVYSSLIDLLVSRRNEPVARKEIEEKLSSVFDNPNDFLKFTLLETKIDNDELSGKEITFQWHSFFGGKDRVYPSTEKWQSQMIKELYETKDWIKRNRNNLNILLNGNRRNSTAMAIGHTFSAVAGFNITMEHRGKLWETHQHPTLNTPDYPIKINLNAENSKKLIVVVAIMKENMKEEVLSFLKESGETNNSVLEITSSIPIVSSDQANKAINQIKENVKNNSAKIGAEEIEFFYAGPSHFSLFLGHRWNAMPKTQCYEWIGTGKYIQSVTLI
ncbi:CD-NTase-associated endodeoxyribonuclease Cap4 [Neobacillus mesonae]|uniref:CD-NTase-associated endodeoxyribonuclease Cap4 n=1 Tax=Neobacillus mesonae TaxID=1193713 RepID=UPI00082F7A27|nr:SAVED domain-containing protein [Neobacillus mesonae]